MKVINRIKKQEDFQKVIHSGKVFKSSQFSVYFIRNELNHIRIGVSIPTKTGNAVVRNKTKRQIKAMLSSFINLSKSLDIVVVPRKGFANSDFINNKANLEEIFKMIGE